MIGVLGSSKSLFISCLLLVGCAIRVGLSFRFLRFSWLTYTLILLYVGGIIVLFIYMCRLSSFSKIERNKIWFLFILLRIFQLTSYIISKTSFWRKFQRLDAISSLYFSRRFFVFLVLGVYLIIGLLIRVFLMEKIKGPFKSLLYV